MGSGPITSLQIEGQKGEAMTDYIFLGSKITVNGEYSHEIKICLLFVRNVMTNLDSLLKSRNITLPTEVHIVKAMVCTCINHVQTTGTCSSHVQLGELDRKEG